MTDIKLPPLPRRAGLDDHSILPEPGFSREQMITYATEAERLGFVRGLEAAAKACEALSWPGRRHTDYIQGQNDACDKVAAAIRTLAAKQQAVQ